MQDTLYIILTPGCKNYCITCCICWTQTSGSKLPQRTQVLHGVGFQFQFFGCHREKGCVCPEKVCEMVFFGCREFQSTEFTCIVLLELQKLMIDNQDVLKSCACWFSDGWVEKTVVHKKMVLGGTFLSCKCSWIFRKTFFC